MTIELPDDFIIDHKTGTSGQKYITVKDLRKIGGSCHIANMNCAFYEHKNYAGTAQCIQLAFKEGLPICNDSKVGMKIHFLDNDETNAAFARIRLTGST